jgi:ComF family protein
MVYNWLQSVQTFLYPPVCVLCGAPGDGGLDLCGGCRRSLSALGPHCALCAAATPLPVEACGHCLRRAPAFARVLAPYRYRAPLDWLVGRLKYQGHLSHARLLGELLWHHLETRAAPVDLILPVPLHPLRLRERGFNQATEIARILARHSALPLDSAALARVKATAPQATLRAKARAANLRGAFAVSEPERVAGQRIALVDDVVTTGSTVEAAAKALLRAGAASVEVWCCARA